MNCVRECLDIFINFWEVFNCFKLLLGEYIFVFFIFEFNKDGDFCIWVFFEKKVDY